MKVSVSFKKHKNKNCRKTMFQMKEPVREIENLQLDLLRYINKIMKLMIIE